MLLIAVLFLPTITGFSQFKDFESIQNNREDSNLKYLRRDDHSYNPKVDINAFDKRYKTGVSRKNKRDVGCSTEPGGTLVVSPNRAGMFGGQMLDISGPCFTSDDPVIKCRFGHNDDFVTHGYKVNSEKARCSVPILTFRGHVMLELSVNFQPYSYSTTILIALESKMEDRLILPYGGKQYGWNETDTKQLTLGWDYSKLTTIADALVDITLIGYREADSVDSEIEWANLYNIGRTQASAKSFTFDTDKQMCTTTFCTDYEIGLVKVELVNQTQANTNRYQIAPVMLGYYVNKAMVAQLGKDWPGKKCKSWFDEDKEITGWKNRLPSCPCTLSQALSDIGRWHTDAGCDIYAGSKCGYHRGAVHCVRSYEATSDGAGNQCCYDKGGNLMNSADTHQGSTADRSYYAGVVPYGKPKFVPSLSHWLADVVPFFYCCLWSDFKHCDLYMEARPTIDCVNYEPPTAGMIFGLGHIKTFDGASHRMCAEGDFTLLATTDTKAEQIQVQGRFAANPYIDAAEAKVYGFSLNSIAVRIGPLDTVELRLRSPTGNKITDLIEVYVNNKPYTFSEKATVWQDFQQFTIINSGKLHSSEPGNFTIILNNGIGIQVAIKMQIMTAVIMIPSKLKEQVVGLLGNFNGDEIDDMNGIPNTAQAILIYQQFQYKWAVNTTDDSIMPQYTKPTFTSITCSKSHVVNNYPFCEDNAECNFDFTLTKDQQISTDSLEMSGRLEELRDFTIPVRSCGLLDIADAVKNNYNYTLGNKVVIQGCKSGNKPEGPTEYTCEKTGLTTQEWQPSISPVCSKTEEDNTDVIIGVVIGLVAFIILVIILAVIAKKILFTKRAHDKYMMSTTKSDTEDA